MYSHIPPHTPHSPQIGATWVSQPFSPFPLGQTGLDSNVAKRGVGERDIQICTSVPAIFHPHEHILRPP